MADIARSASRTGGPLLVRALDLEYIDDDNGVMENPGFLDYRVPVASDMPMIDTEIIEVPNPFHPYGVRGVGETPIVAPLAAVSNAVRDQLGFRNPDLPLSPPICGYGGTGGMMICPYTGVSVSRAEDCPEFNGGGGGGGGCPNSYSSDCGADDEPEEEVEEDVGTYIQYNSCRPWLTQQGKEDLETAGFDATQQGMHEWVYKRAHDEFYNTFGVRAPTDPQYVASEHNKPLTCLFD